MKHWAKDIFVDAFGERTFDAPKDPGRILRPQTPDGALEEDSTSSQDESLSQATTARSSDASSGTDEGSQQARDTIDEAADNVPRDKGTLPTVLHLGQAPIAEPLTVFFAAFSTGELGGDTFDDGDPDLQNESPGLTATEDEESDDDDSDESPGLTEFTEFRQAAWLNELPSERVDQLEQLLYEAGGGLLLEAPSAGVSSRTSNFDLGAWRELGDPETDQLFANLADQYLRIRATARPCDRNTMVDHDSQPVGDTFSNPLAGVGS